MNTISAKLAADKPGEPDGHAYLRGSDYYDGAEADGARKVENESEEE